MTHLDTLTKLCWLLNNEDTVKEILLAALDGGLITPTEYIATCRKQGLLLDKPI